jgi:XTP/dITP diphosphohydrolase
LRAPAAGGLLKPGDTLVVATHNPGKLSEIEALVAPAGLTVVTAGSLGLPEPEETGRTFAENAVLKAIAAAIASGHPALADDSGVCVDALGGDPGVYSARWAGPNKDFATAMQRVEDGLRAAGALTPEQRAAHFVAVLCLAWPSGATATFRGEVKGHMIWPPRGDNGFGYDPMFVPNGYDRTYAEMATEEKRTMSHRALAFAAFARARIPRK